ncbi:XRE family transcriptional regulator [Acidobacteriia bacterium AH_259_A11_L15]|nr:XRE family transcriptional regulator [Acidobacteriia bacterium AH_259_A11_L15]
MKEIIGRNLKSARELAGLSQEELADQLGVSRATLSAIENGHVAIDSTKLLVAARVLGRSVSDFFEEKEAALALLYRAAAEAIAPSQARSRFERFCKAYRELEDIVGVADSLLPPPEYSYSPRVHSRPFQFATQVAHSERERMGLGQLDPIDNIFKLLDEQSVRIFRFPVDDKDMFGFSAFSLQYGPCIFINERNTLERQIFSLAHEYGHLLMHRSFYKSPEPSAGLEKEHELEKMANLFAANFLVPEVGLRDLFLKNVGEKKVGLEDVVFLKHYFSVSGDMMLVRLRDLRLLSEAEYKQLFAELDKHRGDKTRELAPMPKDFLEQWNRFSRFQHLARKAALDEVVSLGKLAELLGLNIVETRRKAQEWRKGLASAQA